MFLHPFYVSLLPKQGKKKTKTKNKRKTRLKYGISFSQFINMKNIHKHEEHTPKKTNTNQIKQFHQSTIDSDLCTYKINK